MLTEKDFDKLIQIFPTRDDFQRLEGRMDKLESLMHQVLQALDRLATAIEKLNIEYAAISEQLSRHERWIQQIAKQAKVKLTD